MGCFEYGKNDTRSINKIYILNFLITHSLGINYRFKKEVISHNLPGPSIQEYNI